MPKDLSVFKKLVVAALIGVGLAFHVERSTHLYLNLEYGQQASKQGVKSGSAFEGQYYSAAKNTVSFSDTEAKDLPVVHFYSRDGAATFVITVIPW